MGREVNRQRRSKIVVNDTLTMSSGVSGRGRRGNRRKKKYKKTKV